MAKFTPPFLDKYTNTPVGNPKDSRNPDKVKDKEWFIRKGEYIYSQWLTGFAYTPYSLANDFAENRVYAQGRQPTTKYMDVLDPKDPSTGMRSGFYNMSWDIVPIFPKYRDIIRGKLSRFDFSTSVEALDDNSFQDRAYMKFKSYVEEKEKEYLAQVNMAMGAEPMETLPDQKAMIKPRSLQEMEMIEAMGGYRLPFESAMEKLLYKSLAVSEWEEIKLRMDEDFIDIAMAACQDYTDPISKIPMSRYVDPAFLIVVNTRDNAYTEISDCAEVRFLTLAQLKDMGLDEDEIRIAAQAFVGYFNNPALDTIIVNGYGWNWQQGSLFRVAVLDMDFASWSTDYFESRTSTNGQELFFKINEKNVGSDKKRKYESKNYERRYQGKWIIGTRIMAPGYGYQYNQVFDADNRPKSSYSIYRISDRSLVSRCISTLDDLQLCVLKFRNAWAKAKPAGLLIEWGSLTGMMRGGKKMEPQDVLKIYTTTGDLLYRASSEGGRPIQGAPPPISELSGGIGELLNEFIATFNLHVGTLGEITAIGRGQDGSLPGGDTLVGVANIAEGATQDSLRMYQMGYKRLKARTCNNLSLRWQLRLVDDDISEYVQSKEGVSGELVKLSFDSIRGRRIQVNCDMIVDDTQKQMAIQAALESIKAAKTGSIGITYADFLIIMQAVERGQVKYAFMWIHHREEQEKAYQAQLQKENMQLNGQNAQALEQAKQQTLAMELQIKQKLSKEEGAIEIEKITTKGIEDRKTLNVKYALETGQMKPEIPVDEPVSSVPLLSEEQPQEQPVM